jgi:hypothetical protein
MFPSQYSIREFYHHLMIFSPMPSVATLIESDLNFGKKITEQLKATKFPFNGVLWLYDEEADDWRLVIASDLVDTEGARETYGKLGEAISNVGGSNFQRVRVTVVSPKSDLFAALRRVLQVCLTSRESACEIGL